MIYQTLSGKHPKPGVGKKENFPSGKKDNFLISEKKGKKDFFKPTKRKQRKERFFEL